jgi:hypothetical protein
MALCLTCSHPSEFNGNPGGRFLEQAQERL